MKEFMFFNKERFEREMNKSFFKTNYERYLMDFIDDSTDFQSTFLPISEDSDKIFLGREYPFKVIKSETIKQFTYSSFPLIMISSKILKSDKKKIIGNVLVEEGESSLFVGNEKIEGIYSSIKINFNYKLKLNNFELNPGISEYFFILNEGYSNFKLRKDYEFILNIPFIRNFSSNKKEINLEDKLPSPDSLFGNY